MRMTLGSAGVVLPRRANAVRSVNVPVTHAMRPPRRPNGRYLNGYGFGLGQNQAEAQVSIDADALRANAMATQTAYEALVNGNALGVQNAYATVAGWVGAPQPYDARVGREAEASAGIIWTAAKMRFGDAVSLPIVYGSHAFEDRFSVEHTPTAIDAAVSTVAVRAAYLYALAREWGRPGAEASAIVAARQEDQSSGASAKSLAAAEELGKRAGGCDIMRVATGEQSWAEYDRQCLGLGSTLKWGVLALTALAIISAAR